MGIRHGDIPFSYADYKTLSASTDKRHELIDGELHMVPAPTVAHQVVSKNIALAIEQHTRRTGCGRMLYAPIDVVLGTGDARSVVQPDILFIAAEGTAILTQDEVVGAPDLIIEILSPATAQRDLGLKKVLYARSGVREYWIVDPQTESVDVFAIEAEAFAAPARYHLGDRLVSTVMPGFYMDLVDVFEGASDAG